MKKKLITAALIIFFGMALAIAGLSCYLHARGSAWILIRGHLFETEVVSTPAARELGLSGRDGLCASCAMLFEFDRPGAYSFWMKDMKFDLDILWIDDGLVVAIEKNVAHEKGTSVVLDPKVKADKVIEMRAGLSDRFGFKAGDRLGAFPF